MGLGFGFALGSGLGCGFGLEQSPLRGAGTRSRAVAASVDNCGPIRVRVRVSVGVGVRVGVRLISTTVVQGDTALRIATENGHNGCVQLLQMTSGSDSEPSSAYRYPMASEAEAMPRMMQVETHERWEPDRPSCPAFDDLDTNADGVISREEFEQYHARTILAARSAAMEPR